MANPPKQERKKPGGPRRRAEAPLPSLAQLLPRQWRRSPAWKHFQTAQVEFLTGMQVLLHDLLEHLKVRDEEERELRRIAVEK